MTTDPIPLIRSAVADAGSQTKFAKECGVTQPYVSQVLAGKTPPSQKILEVIGLERAVVKAS